MKILRYLSVVLIIFNIFHKDVAPLVFVLLAVEIMILENKLRAAIETASEFLQKP